METYADDEWLFFIGDILDLYSSEIFPLIGCGELSSGDDGADMSDCVFRESSTSDKDPLRFFFERENALLKELRNCA